MGFLGGIQMKSKRAKACDISQKVKSTVWERDLHCCILCGAPGAPNAHYISRGQSGLGIPENVVTLCQTCHTAYDQSFQREILKSEIADYLRGKYPGWDDIMLTYQKGD